MPLKQIAADLHSAATPNDAGLASFICAKYSMIQRRVLLCDFSTEALC
jgi:hypothetical protein